MSISSKSSVSVGRLLPFYIVINQQLADFSSHLYRGGGYNTLYQECWSEVILLGTTSKISYDYWATQLNIAQSFILSLSFHKGAIQTDTRLSEHVDWVALNRPFMVIF